MSVQRIEVFLDGGAEPLAVMTGPPFQFVLDTATLTAGGHALRLVIQYVDGASEERSHLFDVAAGEALALADVGFLPGRGVITIDVARDLEAPRQEPWPRLVVALVVGTLLFITLGVQAFMHQGSLPIDGDRENVAVAPAVSGAALYLEHCASCHQPDGEGVPGVFSPLIGSRMANADSVIGRILQGAGAMPAFGDLSDVDVAAVTTYVRTSWGNRFGAVRPEDVAARR